MYSGFGLIVRAIWHFPYKIGIFELDSYQKAKGPG